MVANTEALELNRARRGAVSVEYILLLAFMAIAMIVGSYYFLVNFKMSTVAAGQVRRAQTQQRNVATDPVGQQVVEALRQGM